MIDETKVRSAWVWMAACLLLLGLGTAGCGSGKLWQKPYTTPETSEVENPFVRAKVPEEKTAGGEGMKAEDKYPAGRPEKTGISESKTGPVKHIASAPQQTVFGQKSTKDKKETPKLVHVELAFDNADLYEVLDLTLYDLFGLSYIVDPTLKSMVSFHIVGDYTKDQFVNAFNEALQLNGLSIARGSGNIYKILPRANSAGSANAPVTTVDETGLVGDVTRLVRLRYVAAATAAANVTPFLSKGAAVVQDTVNNALLVTDTAENISRAVAILGVIDIEYFADLSWQIFPVKEVDAAIIAADLDSVLQAGGLYKRQGAAEGSFEIFPIKSMNAILVVTRWPSILTLVQDWLSAMDHMTDSETNVFVYFAENASALDLSDVLQQVFIGKGGTARSSKSATSTGKSSSSRSSMGTSGSSYGSGMGGTSAGLGAGSTTASSQQRATTPSQSKQTIVRPTAAGTGKTAGADEFAGTVEIIPDEVNNAIVFKASNRDYKRVLTILKQLDIQPRQVLINVLVAEVTLSSSTSYGIEWFLNKNIGSLGGSSGDYKVQSALDRTSTDNSTTRAINTPLGTANGFFLSIYDPVDFLTGLISALGSDSDVNILSSPNILALDNKEAVIEVGSDVPTITGTTVTATVGTTNTVQYRKTGILLTVTPHINSSGLVKMELVQEVSDLGDFNKALNNYIFLTRRADTSLVVEDNQTVVLAGLMKSNKNNSQTGVPFLKDIPVLGYLFGAVSKQLTKTELIIMITPHVIKNRSQADEITREFSQKVKDLQQIPSNKKE
ncbi:MAG: type II secretion system secretin GspD [Deltaproteobacteria bacterium]|nr:type II secretion system secretin GspD [Deltaproteobacteria bacterium]